MTTQTAREEIHCHYYMGYSFRLAARDLLYAPSHMFIPQPLLHQLNGATVRDQSDDASHRERTLYHGATFHSSFGNALFKLEVSSLPTSS